MTIDWNAFTPGSALVGGVLVGLAAALFVLLSGRIAGISGVLGGLLIPARKDIAWRVAFILGLVVAPLLTLVFLPALYVAWFRIRPSDVLFESSVPSFAH